MSRLSLKAHFLSQVDKTEDCWLWLGHLNKDGYGQLSRREDGKMKTYSAHRVSYSLSSKKNMDGLVIDHLCRVRNCVNPKHLDLVTRTENLKRDVKTHCKYGHEMIPANNEYNRRNKCMVCRRRWQRESYWRLMGA